MLILALFGVPSGAFGDAVTIQLFGLPESIEPRVRESLTLHGLDIGNRKNVLRFSGQQAIIELRSALNAFGYYHPVIKGGLMSEAGREIARFSIDPGPRVIITHRSLTLHGSAEKDPKVLEAFEGFPLKVGDALDQPSYETGRDKLLDHVIDLGYLGAQWVRHEVLIDEETNQATINLEMDTGGAFRFGETHFHGSNLDPEFLKRFTRYQDGDAYLEQQVTDTQKALINSGYFSKADLSPLSPVPDDDRVPIEAQLAMAPQHRVDLGGGYGTDTGPRLSAGYQNRYINDYGHSVTASAKLSQVWNQLDAGYIIPLEDPTRDRLAFTGKLGLENTVAGRAEVIRGGAHYETGLFGLRETLSLDYLRETFNTGGGNQTTDLLIPSLNLTWVHSDDPLLVRNGIRIDGNLAGAAEGYGSEISFGRAQINAKGIVSPDEDSSVIARAQFGQMITNHFDQMPITERFYTGGGSTVRGFRLFEISPINIYNKRTGGNNLIVGSLEYDRTIYEEWGMAVFADTGYVGYDYVGTFKTGVGVGARWKSPVGLVRLDVGVPLVHALDPVNVYLILGPDL